MLGTLIQAVITGLIKPLLDMWFLNSKIKEAQQQTARADTLDSTSKGAQEASDSEARMLEAVNALKQVRNAKSDPTEL